jgi:hypothetical protein
MTNQEILKAAEGVTGWMLTEELKWLIEQASTRRTVVEIGSWKGRSTKALALAILEVAYSVDHWMDAPPSDDSKVLPDWLEVTSRGAGAVKAEFEHNLAVEIASGKCIAIGLPSDKGSVRMREILGGRKIDMVFIDGDHEYSMVKRDIELWRPMVTDGGLLCGHDYPWPGVNKAVAELLPKHRFLHNTNIWYATA